MYSFLIYVFINVGTLALEKSLESRNASDDLNFDANFVSSISRHHIETI